MIINLFLRMQKWTKKSALSTTIMCISSVDHKFESRWGREIKISNLSLKNWVKGERDEKK